MPNASPEIIANPDRLASLLRLCLLDTPADPAFDRLTRLASRILNAPISTVTLIDDHRQFLKSQLGIGEPWKSKRETPLEYSYCQHVVATASPLIVEDTRVHPLLYDNPLHFRGRAGRLRRDSADHVRWSGIRVVLCDRQKAARLVRRGTRNPDRSGSVGDDGNRTARRTWRAAAD